MSMRYKYLWVLLLFGFLGLGLYLQRPFRERMAAFVTDLSGRTSAQRENIQRSADSLSGIVVKTGEVFSFNERLGPYTEESGYLPERSFRGEVVVVSPGGGVCQLASTLYNAAKIARLEIVERVLHSQPVESILPGLDATVVYGVADLKFKNNHPFPIKILSKIANDQLKIEIWGKEALSNEF